MRLSDLQTKKIVDVNDGRNMGNIIDVNVLENGNIESLKESDVKIYWTDIEKIGEDVILVKKGST